MRMTRESRKEAFVTEQTIRKGSKWAKVSGKRGRWACAKGWRGQIAAAQLHVYPTKDGALISARYWVKDQ
jgi:hypothetical protein